MRVRRVEEGEERTRDQSDQEREGIENISEESGIQPGVLPAYRRDLIHIPIVSGIGRCQRQKGMPTCIFSHSFPVEQERPTPKVATENEKRRLT